MSIEGAPGDPFTDWIPEQKNGSAVDDLQQHLDALVAFLQPFYPAATDIISAELWEYAPGTFDAIFRSAESIGVNGTSGTGSQNYAQTIITMRSGSGGIGKIDLRGTIYAAGPRSGFPTSLVPVDNMLAHLLAPSSIYVARDGGYFLTGLFYLPGSNEQMFKKINR
jgi:hypothetical protein